MNGECKVLQIKGISKTYVTGELTQVALDDVSLSLRDSEFVAILGPSGSGKTTLLNIIGGLDRYDKGDLIINGVSTKKYSDRDWDSYRNHSVGFVFQSYNLIPHQSVLSNVELALTISGVSRAERKKRAMEALVRVGLGEHAHKRPNQLSGGQMQRVAIARALVNDPEILLADEPTGALDSETGVQVIDLLKEVSKDRLVVMVTHNPELAQTYATRIVNLKDGRIVSDTDPCEPEKEGPAVHKNMGKASMSLFTALSLSFNNLRTKKGRTILTAFAGSIGIIGIALILSLSNGVDRYINDIQKSTMTSYPVTIEAQSIDLSSLMAENRGNAGKAVEHGKDGVYSNGSMIERVSAVNYSITKNNLTAFKKYLDDPDSEIHKYVGENGIIYSYTLSYDIYAYDPGGKLLNTDGSTFDDVSKSGASTMFPGMASMVTSVASNNYEELMWGSDGKLVSQALVDSYDLVYGRWPEAYDELVLVLDQNNEVSLTVLYWMGYLPSEEYNDMMEKINAGEKVETETQKLSYEEICQKTFYLLTASDVYKKDEDGRFTDVSDNEKELKKLLENALELKIAGVVRPGEDQDGRLISHAIGYTKALSDYIMEHTDKSEVVTAQKKDIYTDVITGLKFAPDDIASKVEDVKLYIAGLGVSDKAAMFLRAMQTIPGQGGDTDYTQFDETQLAAMFDGFIENADENTLAAWYDAYVSTGSYEDNMKKFGAVSADTPTSVSIYADSFEDKDGIVSAIEHYNESAGEEDKISYTDYVGLLMSSVTTIINVVSYVLIAFVSVSLVVSSIMIGIITYISVLERTKEIGILRAIGASKRNVSQVFNAETFIIGLLAGLIGIGVSLLLLIPGNMIIHALVETDNVSASLPPLGGALLVLLSVLLTLIGGFIPSKAAARKDPVTALRTE